MDLLFMLLPNVKAEPHAASDIGSTEWPQSRVLALALGWASSLDFSKHPVGDQLSAFMIFAFVEREIHPKRIVREVRLRRRVGETKQRVHGGVAIKPYVLLFLITFRNLSGESD